MIVASPRLDWDRQVAEALAPGPTHQAPPCSAVTHRYATTAADRDRLAALVDHYERHLTAIGRAWVIAEAHRRADATELERP